MKDQVYGARLGLEVQGLSLWGLVSGGAFTLRRLRIMCTQFRVVGRMLNLFCKVKVDHFESDLHSKLP